jgi:replicative DNA helicase
VDKELRYQILRAIVRDRSFLKQAYRDVRAEDFSDRGESLIAQAAITFYDKYQEPIGAMLRSQVDELAGRNMGAESKDKLRDLITKIQSGQMELVSVNALIDRVKSLKKATFYDTALDEMITAHESGELTSEVLASLVERANRELSADQIMSTDYFNEDELKKRMERRELWHDNKYPLFLIPELDSKIKAIGRGHLGMFVAPPNAGKGPALLHMDVAYAIQGLNVLHITLEDPKEEVENRLDAILTGIPLNKLRTLPNRLKKRWRRASKRMHGRIKIIDGTDGGWTVTMVERAWETEKKNGFTADVITIDYDDEIECEKPFKGESARRFEFAEIYRRLRRMASKLDCIVWTAAQGTKATEGKKVITMKDVAEDFSKVRKSFLAIGIGADPKVANLKYLNVMRHRLDRSRFGVEIMSKFDSAIFYDTEATDRYKKARQKETNQ